MFVMLKKLFIFGMVLGFSATSTWAFDLTHAKWSDVLSKYRNADGFVSYARLKDDFKSEKNHPLNQYLTDLQSVSASDFSAWKIDDQKAFLINAFNALTIKMVLDRYPLQSIKELGGFLSSPWKRNFFSLLGGRFKNLDRIEHELAGGIYHDARTYAVLCTASVSSPKLSAEVFRGEKLEEKLDSALTEFLSDPSRNHYDVKSGVLELSKLFDWHGDDFKSTFGGVVKTVEKFAPRSAQEAVHRGGRLRFLTWDWELNEPNGDRGVVVFVPAPDPKGTTTTK
jgi:hypothetical protein